MKITVLGAAGTGKTQLVTGLRAALAGNSVPKIPLRIADAPSLADLPPQTGIANDEEAVSCVLLMGLDLLALSSPQHEQEAADRSLRQALDQASVPYTVIYGIGPARLHNALDTLRGLLPCNGQASLQTAQTSAGRKPWIWACDKCSDPQCERHLLSDLMASRADPRLP